MSSNTQNKTNETNTRDIQQNMSDSYDNDFNNRIQSVIEKIRTSSHWYDSDNCQFDCDAKSAETLNEHQKDISNDYGQFRLYGDVGGNYYVLNRLIEMGYLVTISKISDEKDGILLVQYRFNGQSLHIRFGI